MTAAEELARRLGARTAELEAKKLVPMLCEREEAAARVLGAAGWLFELKLDGVRIIADKRGDAVRLYYRKLREATDSYAEIGAAVATLADERLVLDGELVAFDEEGRPDFQRLGHRIQADPSRSGRSAMRVPVVYVVFDVLAVGPYDLRGFPLEARKEILKHILPEDGGIAEGRIRLHPTFGNGVELFRLCREHRLEGVVAKKLGSSYRAGERTTDWLKIKCEHDAEFVVIGWTEGESDRARLGALDVGTYEGDRLVYRGRVGSGLHDAIIDILLDRIVPMEVASPVAEGKYSPKPRRHHCRPELVVSVRYGGWSLDPTGARFLRFPVFRGIRADVVPADCTAAPEDGHELRSAPPAPRARRIHVTGPAQALLGVVSKDALCTYFEAAWPALGRHTKDRACTLVRADGTTLWPPPSWTPKFAGTTTLKTGGREHRGWVVDSVDVLLFAVEAGSPCLRHGAVREDRADVVDFVALRVTAPAPADAVRAAQRVRALAERIGLPAAATSAGEDVIDVLLALGATPAALAAPLATLLARLAEGEDGTASVVHVEAVTTPFSPSPRGNVVVPLAWDEIDRAAAGGIDLADATSRALAARDADPVSEALAAGAGVDVGRVTAAITRIVGAGAGAR